METLHLCGVKSIKSINCTRSWKDDCLRGIEKLTMTGEENNQFCTLKRDVWLWLDGLTLREGFPSETDNPNLLCRLIR